MKRKSSRGSICKRWMAYLMAAAMFICSLDTALLEARAMEDRFTENDTVLDSETATDETAQESEGSAQEETVVGDDGAGVVEETDIEDEPLIFEGGGR